MHACRSLHAHCVQVGAGPTVTVLHEQCLRPLKQTSTLFDISKDSFELYKEEGLSQPLAEPVAVDVACAVHKLVVLLRSVSRHDRRVLCPDHEHGGHCTLHHPHDGPHHAEAHQERQTCKHGPAVKVGKLGPQSACESDASSHRPQHSTCSATVGAIVQRW